MLNQYPITSGQLSIRESGSSITGYDSKTKKWIALNKSLEKLLLLCNGKHTIENIITKLSQVYKDFGSDSTQKAVDTLNSLEDNCIIVLKDTPHPTPIRFREYDFDWPLQAVFVEATNRCNLRCIHCYNRSSPSHHQGLSKEQLFSFFDQLDEIGVFQVYLTGGEPFLRKDICALVEYLHNIGMDTGIFTNGTVIDSSHLACLERIKPKFVAVSLDTIDDVTFHKIRNISSSVVLRNIVNLQKRGIRVIVNTVLFRGLNDSCEELIKLLRFLKATGLTEKDIVVDEFLEIGRGSKLSQYSLLRSTAIKTIREAFREVYNYEYAVEPSYVDGKELSRSSFCGIGESIFYLNSKGDMTLCPVLNDTKFKLGNIFELSVKDIWETSKLLDHFRRRKHILETECATCAFFPNCAGGCKAKSMLLYGSFAAPDYWMCSFFGKGAM